MAPSKEKKAILLSSEVRGRLGKVPWSEPGTRAQATMHCGTGY